MNRAERIEVAAWNLSACPDVGPHLEEHIEELQAALDLPDDFQSEEDFGEAMLPDCAKCYPEGMP